MSTITNDAENKGKPEPEAARPKGRRKPTREAKAAKNAGTAKKVTRQGLGPRQQEGRGHRHDEAG